MNILLKTFLLNNYISRLHKIENGIIYYIVFGVIVLYM